MTGNTALPFQFHTAIQAKTRVKMTTFEFFMTFKKEQKHQQKKRFLSHSRVQLFSLRQRGAYCLNDWLKGEIKVFSHFPLTQETDTTISTHTDGAAHHLQPKTPGCPKHVNIPIFCQLNCTRRILSQPPVTEEREDISHETSVAHGSMQRMLAPFFSSAFPSLPPPLHGVHWISTILPWCDKVRNWILCAAHLRPHLCHDWVKTRSQQAAKSARRHLRYCLVQQYPMDALPTSSVRI